MKLQPAIGKRFAPTLFGLGILIIVLLSWWHSSRYSERHLHYFGKRSLEVFSASSLIRFSFVDGHIGSPGKQRGYRQRNARGKFVIRPLVPQFRAGSGILEMSFGYWHLTLAALIGMLGALVTDLRRARRGRRESCGESEASGVDE